MKKHCVLLALALWAVCILSACGDADPSESRPQSGGPGRMVASIEISVQPHDPEFDRTYVTQENMNSLLALLRSMSGGAEPEQEPDINGGQNCYNATVTYSNGDQTIYYLLGHTYMRLGSEPWCLIEREQSMAFTDFIRTHPSDDGSAPIETTASPQDTTVPASTGE